MLKIKDNVDLKELKKKYKFQLEYDFDKSTGISWVDKIYKTRKDSIIQYSILFKITDIDDKHIYLNYIEKEEFDTLYDLIKADLVEKVEN